MTGTEILDDLTKRARESGDVIPFRNGRLFCHSDAVRAILITEDASFRKSPALRWARLTLGKGLLTSDGPLHRQQRPLIQPALHPKRLAGYTDIMVKHASQIAVDWTDGLFIQTHRQMMRLTLRIVAEALFGVAVGPEADALSEAMSLNVLAFRKLTRPWGWLLAILPSVSNFRYLRARHRLIRTLGRFISDRRKSGIVRDDLLSRLLSARDAQGKPAMSERQLMDECVTLFAAGHETTANALTFTLWLLAEHQDIQNRLHEEIGTVIGSSRLPTIDDLDHLPYARAVITESMRLYPPAWIQARQAISPCVIAGQSIKRGDVIFVSQWITHHDPRWWPNAAEFQPDRFMQDPPEGRPRWAYFPFGGGSRNCVGEAFAWAEAVIVLVTLAQHWQFQSTQNHVLELETGITLRPKDEVQLKVTARVLKESPACSLSAQTL